MKRFMQTRTQSLKCSPAMPIGFQVARILSSTIKTHIKRYFDHWRLHFFPSVTLHASQKAFNPRSYTAFNLLQIHRTKKSLNMASVTATKAPALPLSLQAEFADLAYAVTVQDDDAIFESVFDRSWASDVVEMLVVRNMCRLLSPPTIPRLRNFPSYVFHLET